jgi:hypothetical protein
MLKLVPRICLLALANTIVSAVGVASPAAAGKLSPPLSSAAFTWETVLSLPHDPKHRLGNVWVFEGGEAFAVGNEIIAHCTSNGTCDITMLTGGEVLWDVWGESPTSVYAVGKLGVVMHYDGRSWTTEHPMPTARHPADERSLLLYRVGPFLPGAVAAFGPEHAFKRDGSSWITVKGRELEGMFRTWEGRGRPFASCGGHLIGPTWHIGTRGNPTWVTCADDSAFWVRGQTVEPRGRAPKACYAGASEVFLGDLFAVCGEHLWRNVGRRWSPVVTPEEFHHLFTTTTCLYALDSYSVMRHCVVPTENK